MHVWEPRLLFEIVNTYLITFTAILPFMLGESGALGVHLIIVVYPTGPYRKQKQIPINKAESPYVSSDSLLCFVLLNLNNKRTCTHGMCATTRTHARTRTHTHESVTTQLREGSLFCIFWQADPGPAVSAFDPRRPTGHRVLAAYATASRLTEKQIQALISHTCCASTQ